MAEKVPEGFLHRGCAGGVLLTACKVGCCSEKVSTRASHRTWRGSRAAWVRRHQAPEVRGHGLMQVDHLFQAKGIVKG